jgi:LysM repeat protein
MIEDAHRQIASGALKSVLRELTPWYGSERFSAEESRQFTELLSQLAGEVIYSRKHYLQDPYVVRAGDTLPQIAQQYRVPWQLLGKINGVEDPERLTPGSKLKVLRGPFDAKVLLDRYELVLYVEGLYAGRFPIGIGRDQPQLEGDYVVRKKMTQPTYYGPNGTVRAEDPENPLGKYWIGLDERIGIHGTNDIRNLRRADGRGSVCLGDRDIGDVFDILSAETPSCPGSKVAIRRSVESPPAVAERGASEPGRR